MITCYCRQGVRYKGIGYEQLCVMLLRNRDRCYLTREKLSTD